jgi:uncharacterized protein (TIGR00266 family)
MDIEIRNGPSYALAVVGLDPGETVVAEGGAMVGKDTHVDMETTTRGGDKGGGMLGGLFKGLKRLVAGESFFVNRFTAQGKAGQVTFAPTFPGDIRVHDMDGSTPLLLQSSAFLCSGEHVEVDAKWGGARTFFGGEGLIMLRATGRGPLVFNSFGGIQPIDLDGAFVVDTGHIVAFEETLRFSVGRFAQSWNAFFFGGEGLVCTFEGRGRLWIQTRNPAEFGAAVGPSLPARR